MSGSRLGRGRGGRLAVYGGCGVVVILLVLLYRAATSEMARLRELHIQCAHQQESLAAQLQVIFEYKVRLEKSLAEEKSSNAAVKQELQQRASREKSLRDKDSVEAMQRFNSLQQTYKLLQTEHQDLQEDCKKRDKQALEETNKLELTLQDLRSRIKQITEDKEKTVEEKEKVLNNFKNKYLKLETDKNNFEKKYNELMASTGNTDSTIEHLKKEVFQLKRELEDEKRQCKATSVQPSLASQKPSQQANENSPDNTGVDVGKAGQDEENGQREAAGEAKKNVVSSSSMKTMSPLKEETSTRTNAESASSNKIVKTASKMKLPRGVLPIPLIMDARDGENLEDERAKEKMGKNEEPVQNSAGKKKDVVLDTPDSKEKDQIERDNIDPPYPVLSPNRHVADQVVVRRQNGNWLRVKPGVQEIGEELNPIVRLAGLDDVGDKQLDAVDDQYVGAEYEPQPQQKAHDLRLVESEEEEDEDDPEDTI